MKKIVILIAFVLISLSSFSQIRWTTQYYNPEFKWVKIDSGLWINVYGKFYLPALAQGGAAVLQTNTSGQVGNIPITASLPLSIDFTGTSINTSMTQVGGASNGWMSSYQWNSISAQAGQWTTCTSGIYRNSGNVGIGTTNPQYPLDVNGQSNHLELSATYSFDVMNGFIEFPFWQTGNLAGNTLTLDESFNIIYTGNSAKILTGFLNSVNPINVHGDGRVVRIWGSSNTNTLTIPKTMTGTLNIPYDIVLKQGDWVELTYNYILNKWLFTGSGGQTSYDNNKTVNGTLSNPHITKNDTATKYVSVNPYDGKFSYNNPIIDYIFNNVDYLANNNKSENFLIQNNLYEVGNDTCQSDRVTIGNTYEQGNLINGTGNLITGSGTIVAGTTDTIKSNSSAIIGCVSTAIDSSGLTDITVIGVNGQRIGNINNRKFPATKAGVSGRTYFQTVSADTVISLTTPLTRIINGPCFSGNNGFITFDGRWRISYIIIYNAGATPINIMLGNASNDNSYMHSTTIAAGAYLDCTFLLKPYYDSDYKVYISSLSWGSNSVCVFGKEEYFVY